MENTNVYVGVIFYHWGHPEKLYIIVYQTPKEVRIQRITKGKEAFKSVFKFDDVLNFFITGDWLKVENIRDNKEQQIMSEMWWDSLSKTDKDFFLKEYSDITTDINTIYILQHEGEHKAIAEKSEIRYKPEQPYYKGKGEHSVRQLEQICEEYKEYVHFINSGQINSISEEDLKDIAGIIAENIIQIKRIPTSTAEDYEIVSDMCFDIIKKHYKI